MDGYTKQLIQETQASVCIPVHDLAAHEKALVEYFREFERKSLKHIPQEFAYKFDRLTLTGELAKQFESLMNYDVNAFVKLGAPTL